MADSGTTLSFVVENGVRTASMQHFSRYGCRVLYFVNSKASALVVLTYLVSTTVSII